MKLLGTIFDINLKEYSSLKAEDENFLTAEAKNFKKVIPYNNFERLE
jgi:hypothetical protein